MKVGDYGFVKGISRDYGIGKITQLNSGYSSNDGELIDIQFKQFKHSIPKKNVISSPFIIDLIGVGDVLVVKDFVDEACMIFTDIYLIQNEQQLINIKSDLEKNKNKKLYSIVTKEAFESMEYKIGE